ncbi:C45 family autoproteolytic acyltransferase/hydolase [Ferviditalea candida]|uniref:C45 family peptidase n=1 Tax=Ferviditalea candida TaxID=3108399 RepID=A0ABU5ZEB2_9BACL|nr:C45 family peptidase [Paenibacillaceae bacterium T2]
MIKRLKLHGSPKEIGEMHGREGRAEILRSMETYEALFYEYKQISWKKAKTIALEHVEAIRSYDEQLIEEMEGVARGSGLDFEDILALNARSEIALAGRKKKAFADGCTAVGVFPPISSDTIIGQNWDWKARQKESLLLLEIELADKPAITMLTEGGIIGKIGMNSAGVGVCLNALITNKRSKQVPIHLGLRSVLNSRSLHEAISKINHGQMASTANFLIGAADDEGNGMAVSIEVSPVGIDLLDNSGGKIVHTNHVCSADLKNSIADLNEFIFEDSMLRKKRAEQLLGMSQHAGDAVDERKLKKLFSDTFNAPNSINHYENPRVPEHRRMETVFSIVMNLSKKQMHLCVGKPTPEGYAMV